MVATAYLLGVSTRRVTRRVEKLAASLGVTQLSKSQVSAMAKHQDEQVTAFRNRPLDQGPYSFVWVHALTQKVREGGRIINVRIGTGSGTLPLATGPVPGFDPLFRDALICVRRSTRCSPGSAPSRVASASAGWLCIREGALAPLL